MAYFRGAFRRRIAWVFGLQFVTVLSICVLSIYDVVPTVVVVAVIVAVTAIAWAATRREWRPVRALARIVNRWDGQQFDPDQLQLERLSAHVDPDVASLARALRNFAVSIAGYNKRERNFTRDASHELRSPLTVIKMSVDALNEEQGLSQLGVRSLGRIKRATREMEILVETLLLLARETDTGANDARFVVNDVLRTELDAARAWLADRPITLQFEESERFALDGSARALSVLCWQLIRDACQRIERGRVSIAVLPGLVRVSSHEDSAVTGDAATPVSAADRHGFELAIAQRISDRLGWPLDLRMHPGEESVASIHFPHPLPVDHEPVA